MVHKFGNNVFGNISITVSLENYLELEDMYENLIKKYKVKAITVVIVEMKEFTRRLLKIKKTCGSLQTFNR